MFHLIFNMKKGVTSSDKAQEIAKEFLETLKSEESVSGFMGALSKKAEFYPEIREAFLTVATEYEKDSVEENLARVRGILKGGIN